MKVIKTKETFTTKQGESKTVWHEVGRVFEHGGKEYIKLSMYPHIVYYVFEPKIEEVSEDKE